MKANDRKAAFDVLWEIESFPLYVEAAKEEAAREDAGDEKEKKKSSKDKDKKKSKVELTFNPLGTRCVFCTLKSI